MMNGSLRQVQIKNYKSIGQAVVNLGRFTALVGPNGSGKSNFLGALAFVKDCLSGSIELAFKNLGGIGAVRRKSGGHPTHIGLRLIIDLPDSTVADYSFEIAARPHERFRVARERCSVSRLLQPEVSFEVEGGHFKREIPGIRPQVASDRLALYAASATEEFRPVYDFLTAMRLYSIVPTKLRDLQEPDSGESLKSDGSNAAAVLKRLRDNPQGKAHYERICRLLGSIVEGISKVDYQPVGQMETLLFRQDVGARHPWKLEALNMSDGTLRVLGLLLAVYQLNPASVIAIEEPESTVHPAAAEVVIGVLLDTSAERQILITTHSPDILDSKELRDDQIRIVTMQHGATVIAPLGEASRQAIREHLFTPGELLRSNELDQDYATAEQLGNQLRLFGSPAVAEEVPQP